LYVHRPWRRNAVAGSLLQRVVETARAGGAKRLYVSATRSESAVGFYTTSGFTPIAVADAELFEREPDDIHMERPL
jgi:N-acetylglutamate synthase-like GNAT family acetyltransferase